MTTKKLCILAMLTAMYVVLSAFLKFTLFSNVMVDLGYIVFTVALCMYGPWGAVVGVIGCALESILFTAYGFSISWCAANLAIGLICGFGFRTARSELGKHLIILCAVAVGMLVIKTAIECPLYGIPVEVKIPKNAVAFAADTVTMMLGLWVWKLIQKPVEIYVNQ